MKKAFILYGLVALILACEACLPADSRSTGSAVGQTALSAKIRDEITPYVLDVAAWELNNLVAAGDKESAKGPGETDFSSLPENISAELAAENITVFPRVMVKLVEPPLLLVVSPRYRIAYFDRILLIPGLSTAVMVQIEARVDALDLSSLVFRLGGFGAAYPAIVSPDMKEEQIVSAAVEEWAHQYLAFKPLGFLYLLDSLGMRQDPDVIVMNETLAGMIAEEIGQKVYERYYMDAGGRVAGSSQTSFDFNREMRETRLNVDRLLAAGKISEAERYMEERRTDFNRWGYPIRKLNQAYFAFHGIYGQDPGAVSPVYQDMLELRKASPGLSAFINKVAAMTSYGELEEALNGPAR